jgi:hypothetical protein
MIWGDKDIGNIESGEKIGRTDLPDEEITQGMSGLGRALCFEC